MVREGGRGVRDEQTRSRYRLPPAAACTSTSARARCATAPTCPSPSPASLLHPESHGSWPAPRSLTIDNLNNDPVAGGVLLSASDLQALAAVALAVIHVRRDGSIVCGGLAAGGVAGRWRARIAAATHGVGAHDCTCLVWTACLGRQLEAAGGLGPTAHMSTASLCHNP